MQTQCILNDTQYHLSSHVAIQRSQEVVLTNENASFSLLTFSFSILTFPLNRKPNQTKTPKETSKQKTILKRQEKLFLLHACDT